MGYRGNDQPPVVLEADEAAVEEMVDARCEQQTVLSVETFLVALTPAG